MALDQSALLSDLLAAMRAGDGIDQVRVIPSGLSSSSPTPRRAVTKTTSGPSPAADSPKHPWKPSTTRATLTPPSPSNSNQQAEATADTHTRTPPQHGTLSRDHIVSPGPRRLLSAEPSRHCLEHLSVGLQQPRAGHDREMSRAGHARLIRPRPLSLLVRPTQDP
jgi:hypothetical protein